MRFKIFSLILLGLSLFASVNAQATPTDAYFLAPDDDGIIQAWHWGEDSPTVLTSAAVSIVDFTVANDRLSVVYTSDSQLWLQPLHDAEPYVIAELDPEASPSAFPVFSPDDSLLAYGNNGIWLYGLDGSEPPQQVIESITYDRDTTTDVGTLRYYFPMQFIPDSDWLIVRIGLWEGRGAGLLNIQTGEIVELGPLFAHDEVLLLADGRLIVYGNGEMYGEPNIEITTLDTLDQRDILIDLTTFLPGTIMLIDQIVEVQPGVLRILSSNYSRENSSPIDNSWVVFDYDLETNAVIGEIQPIPLLSGDNPNRQDFIGRLHGDWLAFYLDGTADTQLDGRGILTGELVILNVITGEQITLEGFDEVSSLLWK